MKLRGAGFLKTLFKYNKKKDWLFIYKQVITLLLWRQRDTMKLAKKKKKKTKPGRLYASTAGGQNDTNKLPEREPVPSSPAADNEASLGHGLCEIMG